MEFVDRTEELTELKRALKAGTNSSFVVIYGRRRLGKSTLIRKALHHRDVFYMAGDFINTVQLNLFRDQLSVKFPEISNINFEGWEEILKLINSLTVERFTLCFDEFPYMVKHSPELPSLLQRLIDSGELKYNIIICGSSQRMMQKLVLSSTEPLYGRAQAIINLGPIAIPYMQEALHFDAVSCIEEYSVWGGVPRYWEIREEYGDLISAISNTMLTSIGILYDEPNRLFIDDLTSSVQSESLLSVIASGANRLSEIATRMGREATALSAPLDRLIQMNYIYRDIPFGESAKKSKRGLYKIKDPFIKFYYTFIVPNKSNIGRGRKNYIRELIERDFAHFVGGFWEYQCREAISGNKLFGHLWKEASRWWGTLNTPYGPKQMEVDLLAESFDGSSVLIGECKWTNPEISAKLIKDLKEKASLLPFIRDKVVIPVLFLKNRPKDEKLPEDIHILYPEDIIQLSSSN